MLKVIKYIARMSTLLLLTACGEFFETQEAVELKSLALSRHAADIMVGDTLIINTRLSPDMATASYNWCIDKGDSAAVTQIGRKIIGQHAGQVRVKVDVVVRAFVDSVTSIQTLSDTCLVNVLDWSMPPTNAYPHETIIVAALHLGHKVKGDSLEEMKIVATVNNKARCAAEKKIQYDVPYLFFRIGSDDYGETAILEGYSPARKRRIILGKMILDGETHGTLSHPLQLKVEDWE